MSTARIREALERLATLEGGSTPTVLAALLEVERIEKAAKDQHGRHPEDINSDFWELMESIREGAP